MILDLNKIKAKDLVKSINKGHLIVFPTDIEYCIGCDALNEESVKKLRELTNSSSILTILPQSKQWIYKNLKAKKGFIRKLPGPYVYILTMKNNKILRNITTTNYIAIRVPDHKLIRIIQKIKKPFVIERIYNKKTRSISSLTKKIKNNVDLIIDQGEIEDKPFSILDIREDLTKIIVNK